MAAGHPEVPHDWVDITILGDPQNLAYCVRKGCGTYRTEAGTEFESHCGNACPFEGLAEDCPQEHWCPCCGDCQYCYNESCYDGCSFHGFEVRRP